MLLSSEHGPAIISLETGDELTVASTYEAVKLQYVVGARAQANNPAKQCKSISLRVYDNFFIVAAVDVSGKPSKTAFSNTWDFRVTTQRL